MLDGAVSDSVEAASLSLNQVRNRFIAHTVPWTDYGSKRDDTVSMNNCLHSESHRHLLCVVGTGGRWKGQSEIFTWHFDVS